MRLIIFSAILMTLISARLEAADPPIDVPPGQIAGTVTNDQGQPIEGAVVNTWFPKNQIKTDKDGRFHLSGLGTDQKIELRISKTGYSPWYEPTQSIGATDLTIQMSTKTFFQGTVYSPDGKPVANALVRGDSGPKTVGNGIYRLNVWTDTKSDAQGHYKLMVAPDKYTIQTRVADTGIASVKTSIAADESVTQDIHLETGIRFVVHCVDGDTNAAIPGVEVSVPRQKDMRATTDANGDAVFENMPADQFEFDTNRSDYVQSWSTDAINTKMRERPQNLSLHSDDIKFNVTADAAPVTVQMEKGVTLSGHVVDPDGKPVAGATVATARCGWGDSIDMTQRFTAHSDAQGAFSLILPASGDDTFDLIAHDGNYNHWRTWANGVTDPMQTKSGDHPDNITIKLTNPSTIKGQVVDPQGNPLPYKSVRVMSTDDRDSRYLAPEAQTDKDGHFEIKFVRPGDVLVQVEPFYVKMDQVQTPPIAGGRIKVNENEDIEGITVTAKRD